MNNLEAAVAEAARQLDALGIPYMVIGGFAVTIWGGPRLTQDVDVTIQCRTDDASRIASLTSAFQSRVTDPLRFVQETRVLHFASSILRPSALVG